MTPLLVDLASWWLQAGLLLGAGLVLPGARPAARPRREAPARPAPPRGGDPPAAPPAASRPARRTELAGTGPVFSLAHSRHRRRPGRVGLRRDGGPRPPRGRRGAPARLARGRAPPAPVPSPPLPPARSPPSADRLRRSRAPARRPRSSSPARSRLPSRSAGSPRDPPSRRASRRSTPPSRRPWPATSSST